MIEGVKVIDLVTREDDRGYLIEVARHAGDPEPHGVVHKFGQVYLVGNPGTGFSSATGARSSCSRMTAPTARPAAR